MDKIIAGVDIGGTHVTVSLVDARKGEIIKDSLERRHIDTTLGRKEVIESWADAIRSSYKKAGVTSAHLGFAMPGPFDYKNGISWITGLHKYESLYGQDVRQLLAAELNVSPESLAFINDATAFLSGELHAGAGIGYSNLVGITLGTGLGSAAYYRNTFEEGDLFCFDFRGGKCEEYLSARWLTTAYFSKSGKLLGGVRELSELAAQDRLARETFEEFGNNLGLILRNRYADQSPEAIVIGGNIARAWEWFVPSCIRTMEANGRAFLLKPARLGEEAALIGASCLWW